MATEIRNCSRLEVKVNDILPTLTQWGVQDTRTNKIIRGASTREVARNFAKRSRFLRVVKRDVLAFEWCTEKQAW